MTETASGFSDLRQTGLIIINIIMKQSLVRILGIILTVVLSINANMAQAQDSGDAKKEESPWKVGGDVSVTFLSSAFSDAWSAKDGGVNNLTIGGLANIYAKYKLGKVSWDNNFLAQYTTQRTDANPDFIKTLDKLELLSFAGYEATKNWYYSGALSVKTQWTPTYTTSSITGQRDSLLTTFFAPGEILVGPGMKYNFGDKKTKSQLTMNISPATAKFIIVGSQAVADASYGGETSQFEFGAALLATYRVAILENLTYASNLELFSNYLNEPQYVDIKWANIVSTNILKIVTVNLSFDLRYDKDLIDQVRTAYTFGVGLGYKF